MILSCKVGGQAERKKRTIDENLIALLHNWDLDESRWRDGTFVFVGELRQFGETGCDGKCRISRGKAGKGQRVGIFPKDKFISSQNDKTYGVHLRLHCVDETLEESSWISNAAAANANSRTYIVLGTGLEILQ